MRVDIMGRNLFADNNEKQSNVPVKQSGRNLFANDEPAPEESFLKKLPRNIAIGLTHAGRELHNLPHDIASGVDAVGSGMGRLLGAPEFQEKNSNFASYFPYDEKNYANVFGQKGPPTPVDTIIQKGIEVAPEIWSGVNALRGMKLFPHLTRRGASKKLRKARSLSEEREIGTLNVNPELIEDAAQYLPNNLLERNLMGSSQAGDYNSLFDLQSKLGKVSSQRMGKIRSLFAPEAQIKGEAGLASRGRLLDAIHENLQSQGHNDISNLLRKGQDEYRRYMKFKPYRNALATAGAAYTIPKNALTDLIKKLVFHNGQ